MLTNIEYCDAAIQNGLDLFPVQSDKRPYYGFKWQDDRTKEERSRLLREDVWGVAIPCKKNLLCIDFDADADVLFYSFLQRLWDERKDLAYKFWVEKTPHGFHMIFRVEGEAPGNTKLARRNGDPARWSEKHGRNENADETVVQIETRGDGGYFVTFPSPGYDWQSIRVDGGPDMGVKPIWELEPITEADIDWLFEIARSFDTYAPPRSMKRNAVKPVAPERLAEFKRQQHKERKRGTFVCDPKCFYGADCSLERYEDLLENYGWQKGTTDADGRIRYWRPGIPCDPANYSGNLAEVDGCWLLYVFTTNSELPADCGLTAWQFLMYEERFTDAKHPSEILWDEYLHWQDAWYVDHERGSEDYWKPIVQHLERNQNFFNRRYGR